MKRRLIFLYLFFSIFFVDKAHSADVIDLFPEGARNNWEAMAASNHAWWQYVVLKKDGSLTDDRGFVDALYYEITGNTTYAVQAWNIYSGLPGRTYNTSAALPGGGTGNFRNFKRDWLLSMSSVYSMVCSGPTPGAGAANCANFKDVINYMIDTVFCDYHSGPTFNCAAGGGIRSQDSDELVGEQMGVLAFAAAIRNSDPTRSNEILTKTGQFDPYQSGVTVSFGGLVATGTDLLNMRNAIKRYFTTLALGGQWIESTEYNQGTISYAMLGAKLLAATYGVDYFPEITNLSAAFGEASWQQLVPGFSTQYQWGDTQDIDVFHRWTANAYLSNVIYGHNDNQACYILNQIWNTTTSWKNDYWFLLADGNCSQTAPSGITRYNASGMGISYFHTGWNSSDSFFTSHFKPATYVDHDYDAFTNYTLWRNGGWAVNSTHGYFSGTTSEGGYLNGLRVAGLFPTHVSEVRKQIAYEVGADYQYHVGVAGGQQGYTDVTAPAEALHEYTRSYMYRHNADLSDTIIVFDRLNAQNPINLSNYTVGYHSTFRSVMDAALGKNQIIMQTYNDPTRTTNRVTYTAKNGETVYNDLFIDSSAYTYSEDNMISPNNVCCGGYFGTTNDTRRYRFVITPTSTAQHQTWGQVVSVGSNPTVTQSSSTSGESSKGFLVKPGSENIFYLFNAADRTSDLPTPTPTQGGKAVKDPNRINLLKPLHYFKTGTTISYTATASTSRYFIADLNPALTWSLSIDGAASSPITPSTQGLYTSTISGTGSHTLVISTTPTTPTCTQISALCTTSSTCNAAGWCWENRGNGNQCYDLCVVTPDPCDTNTCTVCLTQNTCTNSALHCFWWTNSTCHNQPETISPTGNNILGYGVWGTGAF